MTGLLHPPLVVHRACQCIIWSRYNQAKARVPWAKEPRWLQLRQNASTTSPKSFQQAHSLNEGSGTCLHTMGL